MKIVTRVKKPKQNESVGKKIEYARTKMLMSQDTLANKIGRKRPEITMWENGTRTPDIQTLKDIAVALGVSTDYLLGLSDVENYDTNNIAINKVTGLSEKTIKTLMILNNNYNGYLISTINYLIEQEMLYDDTSSIYNANVDNERIYEITSAIVGNKPTEKRIITEIDKYFKAKINDKEIFCIANNTLEKYINNDNEPLDNSEFIYGQDITDTIFLNRIKRLLEDAKQDIIKSEE